MRVTKFFTLVIVVVMACTSFGTARAATLSTGAAISPTFFDFSVKAGDHIGSRLLVKNDGNQASDYLIQAGGLAIRNEQYERDYATTFNPEGLESWVTFDRTNFHLEPGERTYIGYTVNVPKNASPGTHYAALFVSTKTNKQNGAGIVTVKRVGSHMYVKVDGTLKEEGKLGSFTSKWWQNGAPVEASLRMLNTGNVHYFADVHYVITDFFGNEKYRFSNNLVVLPNAPRKIALTWDKAPSFGFFKLGGTVKVFDKTEVLPTRYVLVLSAGAFLLMLLAIGVLIGYAIWSRPKNVRRR